MLKQIQAIENKYANIVSLDDIAYKYAFSYWTVNEIQLLGQNGAKDEGEFENIHGRKFKVKVIKELKVYDIEEL